MDDEHEVTVAPTEAIYISYLYIKELNILLLPHPIGRVGTKGNCSTARN